ncbi:ribbon-helix-helix protein, CopG family [Bacillus songklensis]|uniref:Ribbon-helix-helix protein, CopG family n=1 Tax=Bacillus songklensis TaxID=1069116 RepID=A0ABV8AZW6_9BACI
MPNQPTNSAYVSQHRKRMTLKMKKESMRLLDELARSMKCSRTAAIEECIQFVHERWVEKRRDESGSVL